MYPDQYGRPTKALPDIMGPLNIEHEGDVLAPNNDMAEIGPSWAMGKDAKDPLGVVPRGGK